MNEDEAGIDPKGKADRATRLKPQGIASIDSLEPTSRRSAVGKGRQDQDAGHEAKGTGRSSIGDVGAENRGRGAAKVGRAGI